MTIALFVLAAVTPCAMPTLCPTPTQLTSAITAYARDEIEKMYAQTPEDLKDFVPHRVARRVTSVSDMICGEALSDASRSMNCAFTVRYGDDIGYEVATLVWRDGGWAITEEHAVWRKR